MKNNMSIPEARNRLNELAEEHGIPELAEIASQMYRKSSGKRAKVKSPPLTPALAEKIRAFCAKNPEMHQQDVANHFGVNHGRVSEAVNYEV